MTGERAEIFVDALLGLVVSTVVAVAIIADVGGHRGPDLPAYLFAAGVGASMLLRRRFPVLVLVATSAALLAYYAIGYPPVGLAIPLAAALYSAAEAGRARAALTISASLLVISTAFRALDGESLVYLVGFELASSGGTMIAAIALGDGVRVRRLLRAEQRKEADRMVAEERLRIARDVHDVLAHTVSVISVQADVATEALDDDGPAAAAALSAIRSVADDAVRELRGTLRLLRGDSRAPTGSLRHLDAVIKGTTTSGLPVSLRVRGDPVPLPAAVDSTAFRIVQESLTNSLRHAGAASASIVLTYDRDRLGIVVRDDGRGCDPQPKAGTGISGMQERAALLGGWIDAAARPEGGFQVSASLPLEVRS